MPLTDEAKAILGDKFTDDQILDMMLPDAQTKLGATHVIRTKEDDDSFVSLKAKELKDAEIGKYVNELHQKDENDIFEITGLRKGVNEKKHEFVKRVLTDLKTKADAAPGDQALKDQLTQLRETLSKKDEEHATALSKIQQDAFERQLKTAVSSEFNSVTIAVPAHIKTDSEKQAYINKQKSLFEKDFLSTYTPKEDSEGNTVFYKGEKLMTSTKDGKPLTAKDLISEDYSTYFEVESKGQGGAGSGKDGIPSGGFTTREQVYAHLTTQGLQPLTEPFRIEAAKLIKEHGILA